MSDDLATNDRARYDYELLDKLEAGLVLTGQETKSAKTGHMKLKGAHVAFTRGEAVLLGAHIARYPKAGPLPDYDPERSRKLLLHKRELERLRGKREEDGLTIIPLRAYMKAGRIKIEIAIARGKKQYEKRETVKAAEAKREIDRAMRRR